jgi:3-O-methylgallate 3,4-dioxygenase
MIENVVADGFDVAALTQLPYGPLGNSVGHAYGFIYRRLMRDSVIPNIPVFINTYYPPNQPTAGRCFDFGRSLAHAISSWPEDRTVCIFASGGLSHFAVDESLDHMVLEAMRRHDRATLSNIPEAVFQSGTSEIKTWITVAGAMMEAGLEMTLVDYVPCYRSEAGTGCGMAFARWQ